MKNHNFSVSISYPPLHKNNQTAFLSQNRQFQWTNTKNFIFPVIPAYAATLLKSKGYKVFWDDAIAEKLSYKQWLKRLIQRSPSLIAIETKTPVIKTHWKIIKDIKKAFFVIPSEAEESPNLSTSLTNSRVKRSLHFGRDDNTPTIILMGDHVTALPLESFKNSPVDYILTGGDYDFMLLNLVEHLTKGTKLSPGFYFRSNHNLIHRHPEPVEGSPKKQTNTKIINSGKFALKNHNLDILPIIDRALTKNHLYTHHNSNFKHTPGAYIMSGRDCWWGKCTFCSWTTLFPNQSYRTFSPEHSLKEIQNLIENYNIKEVFDDSGTIPTGDWLKKFCHGLIDKGFNKKIKLGCNLRMGALSQKEFNLMKKAGFRFILYGLESANQKTLDKINKNIKVSDIKETLVKAKKAGIENHLTIIIGYPWETEADAQKTLNLARQLFKDGLADSIQATLLIPYPGTPLFKELKQANKLLTLDWDKYDMSQPVIKSPISSQKQIQLIQSLFKGVLTPKFLLKKTLSIRSLNDFTHLAKYSLKFLSKLKDFK